MPNSSTLINDQRLKTFKEIDEMLKQPKGAAFRLFKQAQKELREGEHFFCVDERVDAESVAQLRRMGRIYASTVNAVLIGESGLQLLYAGR
ncbi:MAG: hypothetical protein IDH49_13745 [Gammaproteobacteria bacterium]|nr:hypothetical protein [Gammaproteobacteria bacterium]